MSRRLIDSRMWSNENFTALPAFGRLLQIGLINMADDQGRCKANPAYLRSQVFPYDQIEIEQIQVWLNMMARNDTIMVYQSAGKDYLQFNNWWEYQSLNFAQPSDYPAPDGWQDRIRFNGKGNITLTYNWHRADGELIEDTCDAAGRPLPFVAQLPRKNQGGRPKKQGTPAQMEPTEEPAAKKVDTFPSTFPRGNVNNDYDQQHDQTNVLNNNNGDALRELAMAEAQTAVVVVGAGPLIAELDDDQAMALLTWLWLYNGWHQDDLDYRDQFRRAYRADPFKGMNSPGAVMIAKARARVPAPLADVDRADLMARLRPEREAAP